jgi:hypothetical protein
MTTKEIPCWPKYDLAPIGNGFLAQTCIAERDNFLIAVRGKDEAQALRRLIRRACDLLNVEVTDIKVGD